MKLKALAEALISHHYSPAQEQWPGIEMSKLLAGMVSGHLPTNDTHIQILPRKEEWASTIKITHRGRTSKSVEIHVVVKPDEAYARVTIPGTTGMQRPTSWGTLSSPTPAREIARCELIDPKSFEKAAEAAAEYLTT
jgi:hypothetical protein